MPDPVKDFETKRTHHNRSTDWKFSDPPHTGIYVSKAVHQGTERVTYVSHDLDDGAWQFLGDSMSESGAVLVCLHHPIDGDPSLVELADLPLGWCAERAAFGEPWYRYEHQADESIPESTDPDESGDPPVAKS